MSRHVVLLLMCGILFQWQPTAAVYRDSALTPPSGFSMSLSAKTNRGKQMYSCDRGVWIKTGSSADLIDSSNAKVGSYRSVFDPNTRRSTMFWTLGNSPGVQAESGSSTSGVSGTPVYSQSYSTSAVTQFMCEVTAHQGSGDASLISYVVLTQTTGGMPPHPSLCTIDGTSTGVPFSGVFEFYSQDTQPPATTPKSITPNGRVIQGFFVKGKMAYIFDGKSWHQKGILATLYDVAGGANLGQFGTIANPDRFGSALHWKFNNPNGFWLTGKLSTRPVKVYGNGCPWQLMSITTTGGPPSPVGPYKYAQLTSTRGGLPPANSAGATPGLIWNSPFSGIFWLYTTP